MALSASLTLAGVRGPRQLAQLRLLPSWTAGLLNTFLEIQKADITIIPSITLADYKDIIAHPTDEYIQTAYVRGIGRALARRSLSDRAAAS